MGCNCGGKRIITEKQLEIIKKQLQGALEQQEEKIVDAVKNTQITKKQ